MDVDLTQRSMARAASDFLALSSGPTQVWPDHQMLGTIADPRLVGTQFHDWRSVHPAALEAIGRQAIVEPANAPGWGGKKIRAHEVWDLPEMRLLSLRALLMFCKAWGVDSAHVVDRWTNVLEHGDYSTPHSHYDADGAVVYFMDHGGDNPSGAPDPAVDGRFQLLDSRIPFCCPNRPERPTRGIMPEMSPGLMIAFPAELIHFVKPYYGRRPRVTLAWNICAGLPPADRVIDLSEGVRGTTQRFS